MRPFRLVRTTSFRLATLYLGMFAASVMILGLVVYFTVGREIEAEFDERVERESLALRDYARNHGVDRLAEEITARIDLAAGFDYRLENSSGARIAGNLPAPKARSRVDLSGWIQLAEPDAELDADDGADWERALVTPLDGGALLLVGHELTGVIEARRAVLVAFAWAIAATLALGTAGGLALSAGFLRRIDAITRAVQAIMAGDLRRRIPETGVDDDLAGLARTFNRMLDRTEKLIEANRHVSHDIAHDLRKPLSRTVRRLEAARTGAVDMAGYEGAVDAAIADVHGVLETFDALLRIAQIETGARRAGFASVDLAELANDVAEAFRPAAEDEGKILAIDTRLSLPLSGDRGLLQQLVANLVDNALRHTPGSATIAVRSERRDGAEALVVSDSGLGVPASQRARIFERFYRVEAARTTPGDGLGLSLVAAVAELHGMKVFAEDNLPGLRIVVTMPAKPRVQSV